MTTKEIIAKTAIAIVVITISFLWQLALCDFGCDDGKGFLLFGSSFAISALILIVLYKYGLF